VNAEQLRRSLSIVGEVADAPTMEEFTRRASDGLARVIPAQGISAAAMLVAGLAQAPD
jgi:hypothetical protein